MDISLTGSTLTRGQRADPPVFNDTGSVPPRNPVGKDDIHILVMFPSDNYIVVGSGVHTLSLVCCMEDCMPNPFPITDDQVKALGAMVTPGLIFRNTLINNP